jgi:acyl transferase domain-containing protein
MMSVGLSENKARSYMDRLGGPTSRSKLTMACINSPKNVTISGESQSIHALKSLLDSEDIFARILLVDVAYHSPQMEVVAAEYAKAIKGLESGQAKADHITMISSITGKEATKDDLRSPQYWVANMISLVRFSEAMEQLCDQSARKVRKKLDCSHRGLFRIDALLEVGPHSALEGPTRDIVSAILGSTDIPYSSCLIRKRAGLHSIMTAIGQLHCLGFSVDLEKVNGFGGKAYDRPRTLANLPEYPFDHSRDYWHESRISRTGRLNQQMKLDLLGRPVADWNPSEAKWRNFIRMTELPWVEDHIVCHSNDLNATH